MIKILTGGNLDTELSFGVVLTIAIIAFLIAVAFYVLRSIGLYVLAKRKGFRFKFLAFIPIVWIYVALRLIGEVNFFGKPIKSLAVLFTIVFAVSELINLAYSFLVYYPLVGNYIAGLIESASGVVSDRTIYFIANGNGIEGIKEYIFLYGVGVGSNFEYPYLNINAVVYALNAMTYVGLIFDFASIFITVTVFLNIFRKYWPQKMMLATILSVLLGLFPVFVFVVRNKKEIDYQEYLRKKHAYYRNPYGAYGPGPYGQNPNGQNPYGQNPYQNRTDNPFGEFNDARKVDPFDEFSYDKKEEPFEDFSKGENKEEKDD